MIKNNMKNQKIGEPKKGMGIVGWCAFVTTLTTLLTTAGLFDWDISMIMANPFRKQGQYYTTNTGGNLIEIIGTLPLGLMVCLACGILFFNMLQMNNKYLKYIGSMIFSLGAICFVAEQFGYEYVEQFILINNNALPFSNGLLVALISFLTSLMLNGTIFFGVSKIKKNTIKLLFKGSILIIFTSICAQIFVESVKMGFPRERFRSIGVDIRVASFEAVDRFQLFRPGYSLGGGKSEKIYPLNDNLEAITDGFKSFPSAHTSYCGMVYPLMVLPFILPVFGNKKGICFGLIFPIVIIALVASGRIMAGAHYLSDVTMGGTMSFLMFVIGYTLLFKIQSITKYIDESCNVRQFENRQGIISGITFACLAGVFISLFFI